MEFLLEKVDTIDKLNNMQGNIVPTEIISSGSYMCDCTGCENQCFEFCADGMGDTN